MAKSRAAGAQTAVDVDGDGNCFGIHSSCNCGFTSNVHQLLRGCSRRHAERFVRGCERVEDVVEGDLSRGWRWPSERPTCQWIKEGHHDQPVTILRNCKVFCTKDFPVDAVARSLQCVVQTLDDRLVLLSRQALDILKESHTRFVLNHILHPLCDQRSPWVLDPIPSRVS
jgi:hypothetical protein